MRSYLDLYFTTPNSWLPYKHELKPGAEEQIYKKLGDICVSMRAADHLQMPERIDNVVELTLSPREEKLYRQMERDMLLPYAEGDVPVSYTHLDVYKRQLLTLPAVKRFQKK